MTTIKIENTNKKPEQVERSLKNKLESINKIQEKIKSIANNPDPYIQFIEITKMASDHFYILFRRLLENQDDYNLPFYEKTIRHRSVY